MSMPSTSCSNWEKGTVFLYLLSLPLCIPPPSHHLGVA